jgi:hypothetical protein
MRCKRRKEQKGKKKKKKKKKKKNVESFFFFASVLKHLLHLVGQSGVVRLFWLLHLFFFFLPCPDTGTKTPGWTRHRMQALRGTKKKRKIK